MTENPQDQQVINVCLVCHARVTEDQDRFEVKGLSYRPITWLIHGWCLDVLITINKRLINDALTSLTNGLEQMIDPNIRDCIKFKARCKREEVAKQQE